MPCWETFWNRLESVKHSLNLSFVTLPTECCICSSLVCIAEGGPCVYFCCTGFCCWAPTKDTYYGRLSAAMMTFNWKTVIHTVYSLVSDSGCLYTFWRKAIALAINLVIWLWLFILPKHVWVLSRTGLLIQGSCSFLSLCCLLFAGLCGKVRKHSVWTRIGRKVFGSLILNSRQLYYTLLMK